MTEEFKQYVLSHVPTRILLNKFTSSREFIYKVHGDVATFTFAEIRE